MPRLSIRVLTSLSIALAAIIAGIAAFIPTYTSGVTSVQETVASLRVNSVGRAEKGINEFFAGPSATANSIATMIISTGFQFDAMSSTDIIATLCRMVNDTNGKLQTVTLYTTTGPSAWTCDARFGSMIAGNASGAHTFLHAYPYDLATKRYTTSSPLVTVELNLTRIMEGTTEPERRWTVVQAGYDSAQFSTRVLFDDRGGQPAQLTADVLPRPIGTLLANLGLRSRARALVADGNSRYVFGNSWGASNEVLLPGWRDTTLPEDQRMAFKRIADYDQAVVKEAMSALGGEEAFYAIPSSLSMTMGSGRDRVFIDVVSIRTDYGLNVKALLVIPEIDYLEDVYDQQGKTIGGVCGVLVAMAVMGVFIAYLMVRPLDRLSKRMYRTASLEDDDDDDPTSLLSEVAEMQRAYADMKNELNRMKAYLPQSLLHKSSDDEDDDNDEATSEGMSEQSQERRTMGSSIEHVQTGGSHKLNSSSNPNYASSNYTAGGNSDATSHRSSRKSLVAGAKKGLNTKVTVQMKRVIVCAFNLVDFRKLEQSQNRSSNSVSAMHGQFLGAVLRAVQPNRGFVDLFVGDRVMVTFNAVNNVARAAVRASTSALAVVEETSKLRDMPGLTCGIAGGLSAVGNMGTDAMMRFNVIGPAYRDALMLERFARQQLRLQHNCVESSQEDCSAIAVADSLLPDIGLEMLCEIVDIVAFGNSSYRLVAMLKKAKSMVSDEWMYQIKEGEATDPFATLNQAFIELLSEERGEASQLLSKVRASANGTVSSVAISRLAELLAVPDTEAIEKHATRVPFVIGV